MVLARYKPIDPNLAELCRKLENYFIQWYREKIFSKYKKISDSVVKNTLPNNQLVDLVDRGILYYCYGRLRIKRPTGSRISKLLKDNYKIDTSDYLYGVDQSVVDYAMELKQKAEQNAREYIGFLSSDEVKKEIQDLDFGIFVTDMDEQYSQQYKDSIGKDVDHDDLRLKHLKEQYIENVKFWMSGVGSYELARFRTEGVRLLEQGNVQEFENFVKKRFAGSVTEQRIRFRIKQETALYNVAKESYQLVKDGFGQYIWKTKGDNRVRKDHQKLEGRLCSWSDPPLADSRSGIYAHPSQTWNCYEKNTQVYTEKGFVLIKDVNIGDKVLTLNPATKNLEWSFCTAKVEKYAENIVHLSNNSFDLKVDPAHTFFAYKENLKEYSFVSGIQNLLEDKYFFAVPTQIKNALEFISVEKLKKELIPYNDSVYDIGVEKNHTILIKSENNIHWNSNCRCVAIPVKDF